MGNGFCGRSSCLDGKGIFGWGKGSFSTGFSVAVADLLSETVTEEDKLVVSSLTSMWVASDWAGAFGGSVSAGPFGIPYG